MVRYKHMTEISPRRVASRWLVGEDAYQWKRNEVGKFTITKDIDDLFTNAPDGSWSILINNYWWKFRDFQRNSVWPQAVQQAGKLAATARALAVTIRTAYFGEPYEDHFRAINHASLREVEHEAAWPDGDGVGDFRHEMFAYTELGRVFYGLPFPDQDSREISPELNRRAHSLTRSGLDFLSGVVGNALREGSWLPRPGISSSEDLERWDFTASSSDMPA